MKTYLKKKRKLLNERSNKIYSQRTIQSKTSHLKKYFMARENIIENSDLEISPFIFSHVKKKSKKQEKSRNIKNINEDYYIDDEDMNFELNKEKAKELYKNLLSQTNKDELVSQIYKCLSYDNTNREILDGCFELLKKNGKNNDLIKLIEYHKFCIDEKYIKSIYDECPTMTEEIYIKYLKYLFNTTTKYSELIQYIDENTIKNLIEYKIITKDNTLKIEDKIPLEIEEDYDKVIIQAKIEDKNLSIKLKKLLKEIKDDSFNFLTKYIYIKEMDIYNHNQPIEIETNNILYYNYLLSHLYNKMIIQEEDYSIKYNIENFNIINAYKNVFENIIFKGGEDEKKNNTIDIFNFNLDSLVKNSCGLAQRIMEDEPIPSTADIDSIINDFNKQSLNIKLEKINNFIKIISPFHEDIKIDINQYNKNLLNVFNINSVYKYDFIYKNKLIKYFNNSNYFTERDLEYFFELIDDILKSNVIKEIWKNHCEKNLYNKINYYFDNEDNRKRFIKKIIFLPYSELQTSIQGLTMKHQLKIFLSGYPYSETGDTNMLSKAVKVLELAKRIIIIIHEIAHYLKSALFMITNGIVSNSTRDPNLNFSQEEIEAGKILEKELFGWGGKNMSKAIINVKTALKIINSDNYSKSIKEFKNYINDETQKVELNDKLRKYLDDIKFNYNFENKKSDINAIDLMNCARTNKNDFIVINLNCVK